MRLIEYEDAEFIVSIRTDKKASRFISQTSPDVKNQLKWIEEYKIREAVQDEFYFIFEDETSKPWGTIRLYNFLNNGFTLGSWVSIPKNTNKIAFKAWLLAVEFGFSQLNFENCFLDVRKNNLYVIYFIKFFKPVFIKEDELNLYFSFNRNDFKERRDKAVKLLEIEL